MPWFAQMGAGRAGWYSWDLIDNGGAPSASHIMPALQTVASGDVMPAVRAPPLSSASRPLIHPGIGGVCLAGGWRCAEHEASTMTFMAAGSLDGGRFYRTTLMLKAVVPRVFQAASHRGR